MIVQCPNCQSKSRVDDAGAARGARVRCASCSHVFLPNTAVVSVKPAAASTAADPAASAEEEFGGKTSLFTGVLPRELVGLGAVTAPPAAASAAPPPQTSSAAPVQPAPAPQRKPAPAAAPEADADEGFGANRTQAIDVSQLAAFSAKLSAAPEPKAAAQGGPVPNAARPVAKPKPALGAISAAPVKLAAVLEQETTADVLGTAVIGTHEPGLLSAGVTTASRVIGGLSAALGVCGLIFFAAGNAIYAQLGLMGGSTIDISEAQSPDAQVEQVTSALYRLADGHEALVALGTVANPSDAQAARMEVQFSLTDSQAHVVGQARGPLGAVLSLEELATITLPDSAAAELRRRVQTLPPMAPHSRDRKFMAVIKDPKHPISQWTQSLALVPALPAEPAPVAQPPAASAEPMMPGDTIVDPELPQMAIPPPPQAVSDMPSSQSAQTDEASPEAPVAKPRKKASSKAKKRR